MTLDVYHGRKTKTQQKKPDKRTNIVAESCAYTAEEIMESQGPILRMFRGGEGVGWPGEGGAAGLVIVSSINVVWNAKEW